MIIKSETGKESKIGKKDLQFMERYEKSYGICLSSIKKILSLQYCPIIIYPEKERAVVIC